jgi:hypothetical protein
MHAIPILVAEGISKHLKLLYRWTGEGLRDTPRVAL